MRTAAGTLCAVLLLAGAIAQADGQPTPPPPPLYILYDLNHDGAVNDADLAQFAEYWILYHTNGTYSAAADFNGDKVINYFDAMTMIQGVLSAAAASQSTGARSQAAPLNGRLGSSAHVQRWKALVGTLLRPDGRQSPGQVVQR